MKKKTMNETVFTDQMSFVITGFRPGRFCLATGTIPVTVFFHFFKAQGAPVFITKHAFKAVRAVMFFLPLNCFIRHVHHARKTFNRPKTHKHLRLLLETSP